MNTKRTTLKPGFRQIEGYLYILPICLFFAVFCIYPIIFNIYYGFFEWNGMSANKTYVGFAQFVQLLTSDRYMGKVVRNHVLFFAICVFTELILGVILAYLLHNQRIRFRSLFRAVIYLPCVLAVSLVGTAWKNILEANRGDLNTLLRSVGLGNLARAWLAEPYLALFSIMVIQIWMWTGFAMLLYYANMTHISEDLYEAAKIDGANSLQQFVRITFPMLKSTHVACILLGSISSLKLFDLPYVVTSTGPNHATEFFATYIYRLSFFDFDQGKSSALVVIMLVVAVILTVIQLKFYDLGLTDRKSKRGGRHGQS